MYVISISYTASLESVDKFLQEHIDYLKKYYNLGYFLLSGRKEPRTGGIILSKPMPMEVLESILTEDPFHRENLATFDIIKITPSMASKELNFLINSFIN